MKKILPVVVAAIVAIGFLAWFFSAEQVVKRRTGKLMSTLSMEEGSGKAGRQMNSLALGNLIADELELETPTIEEANGTHQKTEINSGFTWLTSVAVFTKFEVVDYHSISVTGNTAKVSASIEATVALTTYRPADGLYEVELDWIKAKDGWRLTRAKWVEGR